MEKLHLDIHNHLCAIATEQRIIREQLMQYSDGKVLKGDELVGWLGEIYGKLFLDGRLVSDDLEHDLITKDRKRVSVKARKGNKSKWNRTSAIPRVEGIGCPSHLMFIHLNDDYSVDRIWLYPWQDLQKSGRFKEHIVRGSRRSFYFEVSPESDGKYLKYEKMRG